MVNYMGFAAERHLENLRMYEYIGRTAYCKAVAAERHNSERFKKTLQILAHFIGDDMYFNPFEANENQASVALKFGIDQGDVKSWFGRVFVVHFPFMVCMLYDDLPGRIVPIADERDLDLYITQNYNEEINRRRLARQQLRSLSGHYVTLTFIEHGGEHGGHSRYYLQGTEEEHQQYLQKYRGKRRILYRGMLEIQQEREWSNVVNVNTGFICTLKLTDQITVDDENLVNDFSIHNSPFRMSFWKTGRAGTMHRSSPSMSSSDAASLLGIDPWYSSPQLQALIAENRHVINDHIDRVMGRAHMLQSRHRAEIKRKRTGMTPSFLIDVFSPGPESLHVVHPSPDETPVNPATPQMAASDDWGKSSHGRLSYIPTLAQLQRKLSADEENKYVRDIMDEHRNDIQLLYERLRNLVPSEVQRPAKVGVVLVLGRHLPQICTRGCAVQGV
ncbi:hypothetical protein DL89DRAFT_58409 [Linderina pennispora]|uniref:Uncharacterized protein n=1 Tax=Linderina pennispora TaxID=61395 RepID=A0A1Y1VZN6_9FUNG|nr:uncharacterized protein DL89DRAFT_58409 [Linderina pennispora]ORX66702.1 hypothetical protein DL89DRAFT_58409 [Linderina pennispora]